MPKIIIRHRTTKREYPIEETAWQKVDPMFHRMFEVVAAIETPPEVLALNKGHYKQGHLSHDIKPVN